MQTPLAIQPHAWFGRWERVLKERKGRSRERKEERERVDKENTRRVKKWEALLATFPN